MAMTHRHTFHDSYIMNTFEELIERAFAKNKENGTFRFTRVKAKKKNQHDALMIFGIFKFSWR